MKAHINKQATEDMHSSYVKHKLSGVPGTYAELKKEYIALLKLMDEYRSNALLQGKREAITLIQEDGANGFIRAMNIIFIAMKWCGLKESTAKKIYKIASEKVIPMRKRYIAQEHGEDGASDAWMKNELEDYMYIDPGSEM